MKFQSIASFSKGAALLIFFVAVLFVNTTTAQCVDSSEVNDYKVRSVKFRTLFGRIPDRLRRQLESHRGDSYSANQASKYINEVRKFYAEDPAQEKYERLIANKLKLSIKAGRTDLECVKKIEPATCETTFPGNTRCVDVTIRRYFVDVDALDSSPYLLLFPRSFLTTLYGAIPRPLLALNPGIDADQDSRFGPAASVDTVTDLLDLKSVLSDQSDTSSLSPAATTTGPSVAPGVSDDALEIDFLNRSASSVVPENPELQLDGKDTTLLLRLSGRKSLTKSYYDTSTALTFARSNDVALLQNLSLGASFDARNVPLGNGDFFRNAAYFGFNSDLRFKGGAIKLVNLGGKYRWSRNRFFSDNNTLPEFTTENGFEGRAVIDGTIGKGLARVAAWVDGASLNQQLGSYKRAGIQAGYGKEFVLKQKQVVHEISPPELNGPCWTTYPDLPNAKASRKNNQTVGVELIAGAGRAWGDTPEYARFYAGSPIGQFLYDELSSPTLRTFPAGPLIRSLAQSQAGVPASWQNTDRGGTSYWHANLSFSVPIAKWSRPLIPFEWVTSSPVRSDDEDFIGKIPAGAEVCRDLKSTIKTLVSVSGVNLLANQQARDLLTDAEKRDLRLANKPDRTPEEDARLAVARARLDAVKRQVRPQVENLFNSEILPITNFIADHANILAVKPLFVFDVAHLGLAGGVDSRTRFGMGGGLQIDVVTARFEFGYIAAVKRVPGDPRGHFFGRLVMLRLF